ncbi:MAG: D-glycerate 2-kinase [Candidatus Marinimicrobia bacterium]|nr:D-glycerate 2-kinase [Candidatus Neomarinimicrobiota bacterium]
MTTPREELRNHALSIFNSAVERVQPHNCIPQMVRRKGNTLEIRSNRYSLDSYNNVYVIAFGKAAPGMFRTMEDILGQWITKAIIISNELPAGHTSLEKKTIRYYRGSHPLPADRNVEATNHVIDLCRSSTSDDLVIFLISGGGSSLFFAPHERVPLDKYTELVDQLMKSGTTISELNTVRTALSQVKGGQLLTKINNATVINFIISDVIGDPVEFIASGPTVLPSMDTMSQRRMRAKSILEQYKLHRKHAHWLTPVFDHLSPNEPSIEPDTYLVGTNRLALLEAKNRAEEYGYNVTILSTMLKGESREIGHLLGTVMLETLVSGNPLEPPCCILSGGETTVTVHGGGKGGRNQELALGAADILRDAGTGLILSAGTDGIDGPTDAAGAIVDSTTAFRAAREGLSIMDSLHENDSYHFFNALDDLVITGQTGTNVMDIQIGLVE